MSKIQGSPNRSIKNTVSIWASVTDEQSRKGLQSARFPQNPAPLLLKAQSLANWWALIPAMCCSQWLSSVPEVNSFEVMKQISNGRNLMSDMEKRKGKGNQRCEIQENFLILNLSWTSHDIFVQESPRRTFLLFSQSNNCLISHTTCIWQESSCIPNLKTFSLTQIDPTLRT